MEKIPIEKQKIEEKLAKIRDNIKFCSKCGEYLDELGECSNLFCPEEMK